MAILQKWFMAGQHPKRKVIGVIAVLWLIIIGMVFGTSFIKIDKPDGNCKTSRSQTNMILYWTMFGVLIVSILLVMLIEPMMLIKLIKTKATAS
jgi:hypothetical protein